MSGLRRFRITLALVGIASILPSMSIEALGEKQIQTLAVVH